MDPGCRQCASSDPHTASAASRRDFAGGIQCVRKWNLSAGPGVSGWTSALLHRRHGHENSGAASVSQVCGSGASDIGCNQAAYLPRRLVLAYATAYLSVTCIHVIPSDRL